MSLIQSFDSAPDSIIPSELPGPIPRLVRYDPVTLVFPTLMVLFFSGFTTYSVVKQIQDQGQLQQNYTETTAAINGLGPEGRSQTLMVDYTFTVDGTSFTGKSAVPGELYPTLHLGYPLAIRYVPKKPSISHPARWEWPSPGWIQFVMPFFGLPFAIIYFVTLRSQRRLAIGGKATFATVTGCRTGRGGIFLDYKFDTAEGISFQGSGTSPNRKQAGERICILYMPDNPARNGTYPFIAYRILPASAY